jgi:hypothetical protein
MSAKQTKTLNKELIPYQYEVNEEALNDPERIISTRIFLPSGLSAMFVRADHWERITLTVVE